MAKEFKYRGKTLDELKKMSWDELAELMPARIRRRIKRGIVLDKRIQKAIDANKAGNPPAKPIRTHKRDIPVLPDMVGLKFAVYNGKSFEVVEIKPEMIGHYLGEFAETRKRPVHGKAGIGATRSSKHVGKK